LDTSDNKIKISRNMGEVILSLIFTIIGIIFIIYAFQTIPAENIAGQPGIGPRAFPLLASFGLVIFSLLILINRYLRYRSKTAEEKNIVEFEYEGIRRLFFSFAGLIVYYFVTPRIGFLISSILYLLFVYYISGYKNKKLLVFLAVAVNLVIYYVFHGLLNVPLP